MRNIEGNMIGFFNESDRVIVVRNTDFWYTKWKKQKVR